MNTYRTRGVSFIAILILGAFLGFLGCRKVQQIHAAPDIDLTYPATIYGKRVFELGIDEITDLLGRPSSVKTPDNPFAGGPLHGAYLPYTGKGLAFSCNHPNVDAKQRCIAFVVFLAPTRTSNYGGPFNAFTGTLTAGLSGGWKLKNVLEVFAKFFPQDLYDPEAAKSVAIFESMSPDMQEAVRSSGLMPDTMLPGKNRRLLSQIEMIFADHVVEIEYEQNTKFVEKVFVARQRDDFQSLPPTR